MTAKLLAFAIAVFVAAAGPAAADGDHDRARRAREAGEIAPLDRVLAEVARTEPGRVIDVDLEREHGRYVYEVKLLSPEGRRRKLRYDAKSLERLDR